MTAQPADLALACIEDIELAAAATMSKDSWDYVAGGSGAELTLRANRAALDRVRVVPRVLCDVSRRSTAAKLLGTWATVPVAVAPMAYQTLVHPDGELVTARAAAAAGVPFVVSTLSGTPVERLVVPGGTTWFQLYWLADRDQTVSLVRRAEEAGCSALVLTVDVPVMGPRRRDVRNGFTLPAHVTAAHLGEHTAAHIPVCGSAIAAHTAVAFDSSLCWDDVTWLAERTTLPIVLKGILDPADARRASHLGVRAVVVSNHGGRQLDGCVASADALPAVADAVGPECDVLFDSGIRSGTDVLKAVAMGATGVLVGRPALWGLALAGEAGVERVLSLLYDELDNALALAGCPDLAAVARLRWLKGDE